VTGTQTDIGPGLQNERTSLAWRRTGLSLVVAAGTMAKLTARSWDELAVVWLLVGILAGLAVLLASSVSYRARRANHLARTPGPAIAVLSATTVLIGLLSMVYLLA